jgi:hypothetical protein
MSLTRPYLDPRANPLPNLEENLAAARLRPMEDEVRDLVQAVG